MLSDVIGGSALLKMLVMERRGDFALLKMLALLHCSKYWFSEVIGGSALLKMLQTITIYIKNDFPDEYSASHIT